MENHINQFGSDEVKRLAKDMPHKNISIAKDETFNKNGSMQIPVGGFHAFSWFHALYID